MTDLRDRLAKMLAELFCGNWGDNGCDDCCDNRNGMCAAPKFADKLIANGVTIHRWIPVSERLPEDGLPRFSNVKQIKVLAVLISDKGVRTVRSQMRYKDTWATGHDRWLWKYSASEITHWMPLPEPPEEE